MATLYDAYGRVVDPARLEIEQAAPSLTGVRSYWSDHPSRGLTPSRLVAILLEAEQGNPERYYELAEDMEEKDLHYLGVLGTRKRKVSQLEVTVEAASDAAKDVEIADALRAVVQRGAMQSELFDLLDAIGKGSSFSEIIWDTSSQQWMPTRLEWKDPRWFAPDRVDGCTPRLREGAQLVELAPFKFITHVAKAKSGLPIRGGLARMIAWVWLFKNFSLKDWVAFGEVFGQPYRIGKYDPAATPDDKAALLRAVASIGSDAAAIVPKSMMIELLEGGNKSGSIDVYERLARYLDEQISKGVLGQTLTTEVTRGGGNRALGEVHADVAEDIQDADAQQLEETLNRDLTKPFVDLNYGPQKQYPRIRIGRVDKLTLSQRLDYTLKFVPQGLRVEESQVRDRLGWEEPASDAVLLQGSVIAAPGDLPTGAEEDDEESVNADRRRRRSRRPGIAINADQGANPETDATTDAVHELLADDGWTRVVEPMVSPLRAAIARAGSLEEFRDQLADLVRDMDLTTLETVLANAGFAAALAGRLEASR